MLARLFVFALFSLCHTSIHAHMLEGTWITILHPTGLVYPHIEELHVDRDGGFTTKIYGRRDVPGCDGGTQMTSCSPGRLNIEGRIESDLSKSTVAATNTKLVPGAMNGIGTATDERIAQVLFWFGLGEPWLIRYDANTFVMSRVLRPFMKDTAFDGKTDIAIDKHFYKADWGFAQDLIDFSTNLEFSLLKLSCVIGFVSDGSERSRSFRALIRDLNAVSEKRNELLASLHQNPTPELRETVLRVLAALGNTTSAQSADDISAAAKALGVTVEQVERYVREAVIPHKTGFDVSLFSMLRPLEVYIRSCYRKHFG
jgi:hypothetical protein